MLIIQYKSKKRPLEQGKKKGILSLGFLVMMEERERQRLFGMGYVKTES